MKTIKMGLIISSALIFSAACGSAERANQNSAQSAATPQSTAAPQAANANAAAEKTVSDARPASNAAAVKLYTANACAGCHGADGKGVVKDAPDFTSAAWQKGRSDAQVAEGIKKGKLPKMPGYGETLNDQEIKALVDLIRTFSK